MPENGRGPPDQFSINLNMKFKTLETLQPINGNADLCDLLLVARVFRKGIVFVDRVFTVSRADSVLHSSHGSCSSEGLAGRARPPCRRATSPPLGLSSRDAPASTREPPRPQRASRDPDSIGNYSICLESCLLMCHVGQECMGPSGNGRAIPVPWIPTPQGAAKPSGAQWECPGGHALLHQ